MKMFKVLGLSLTAMAAGVGSASLSAAEQLDFSPGFYVIATAGETEIDFGGGTIFGGNGYSIGVGYDINQYLAVEGSYNNYFDMTIDTLKYQANGFTARALARMPLGSWSPFIGLAYSSAKESFLYSGTTYTSSGSEVGVSAGVEVALTETIALRVMSDAYENDNNVEMSVTHIGLVSRF
jgi:hypothetical protein